MPPLFRTPGPGVLMCSVLLATFLQALSMSARAEVQVTGGPDAMNVEARDASVEEVLIALKKAYRLQYGSSANLSRSVSGTFAGSLQQVVSRMLSLQGYDFIAETSTQGVIVAVYGKSTAPVSTVAVAPQAAAVPGKPPLPPSPSTRLPQRAEWRGLARGLSHNIRAPSR